MRRTLILTVVSTILAGTLGMTTMSATPAGAATSSLGVFAGPGDVAAHNAFVEWLPAAIPYASDALDHRFDWSYITSPWVLDQWSPWVRAVPGRKLVLSVPMLPESARGQLSAGAAGQFDQHFRTLAQNMVSRGLGSSVIRLGWEANGNWFPWGASSDTASWKAFYRRIVASMRSVGGASFSFDFNLAAGAAGTNLAFADFYPGDDVVTYVGLDNYDLMWNDSTSTPEQRWNFALTQFNGLRAHKAFADAHGKALSYPEWGLYARGDIQGGGGDNPYYIDRMAEWFAANNVGYQSYFNYDWGGGNLNSFANGKARYQARFGAPTTTTTIPAVSIRSAAVAEGLPGHTARAEFKLVLSAPASGPVSVRATTANGTATAGSDYSALPLSTIGFVAGETTKTVSVPVSGDSVAEGNETFVLNLSSPVGAVLAQAQGLGTILDEEGPPAISVANATVPEGPAGQATSVGFTLSLSSPGAGPVSVKVATANGTAIAGSDYTALPLTTVSFATGETTKKVSVPVTGDSVAEGNETFLLNLTSPVGTVLADAQGLGTILDEEGPPAISVSNASVVEGAPGGAASAGFTVSLSAPAAGPVSVRAATANGTAIAGSDYTALAPTTVTFVAGETAKTVSVPVIGDWEAESNETFVLNLSSPVGAVLADAQGLGTVVNDEGLLNLLLPVMPPASVSVSDATVVEGAPGTATSVSFTVSLSAPVPLLQVISVNVATANGTATGGSDYTALPLTTVSFTTGETTKRVSVPVKGDSVAEGNETLLLKLSSPVGAVLADAQGLGTILDEEGLPTVSVSNASVVEGALGSTASAAFTVSLSAPAAGPVSMRAKTADSTATGGSDYTALASTTTVSFAAGETTKQVLVPITGDSLAEGNETFVVDVYSAVGAVLADSRGLGTILNDD